MSNMSRSVLDQCKHIRMDTKGLDGFEALRLPSPVYTDLVPDSNAYLNHSSWLPGYRSPREHDGINGLTPSEIFLQRLIKSDTYTEKKQESVTHMGKQNCHLSV